MKWEIDGRKIKLVKKKRNKLKTKIYREYLLSFEKVYIKKCYSQFFFILPKVDAINIWKLKKKNKQTKAKEK